MAGISFNEAFDQLGSISTKEAFQALLNSISIDSEGSQTVLYTGISTDAEKARLIEDTAKSKELKHMNFLFTCKTFKTKKALHVKTYITHIETKSGAEQMVA